MITPALIFARNFKNIRHQLGLSKTDMGNILGVTQQQIHKYESGLSQISMKHVHTLCKKFGLDYDLFFDAPMEWDISETELSAKIISLLDFILRRRILNSIRALVD